MNRNDMRRRDVEYTPPAEPKCICKNCGAVGSTPGAKRTCYFCVRHQFYVHSHGRCPQFSTEKYELPVKRAAFVQEDLFNSNTKGKHK